MRVLVIFMLSVLYLPAYAQLLEWSSVEVKPKRLKELGVRRLDITDPRKDEHEGQNFYLYDELGHLSRIADSSLYFEEYTDYSNKVDEQGRLVYEERVDKKISRNNFEYYTYNDQDLLIRKKEIVLAFKELILETEYKYVDGVLSEEVGYVNGSKMSEKKYFNGYDSKPDSAQLYRFGRRDRDGMIYQRFYYEHHPKGEQKAVYEVLLTGDTVRVEKHDRDGNLVFKKEPTPDAKPEYGEITYQTFTYVYKKGKLVEEIRTNDTYRNHDGSDWEGRIQYDKNGNPIPKEGQSAVTPEIVQYSSNGWEVEASIFKGDTASKELNRKTADGSEKRLEYLNPIYNRQITEISQFDRNGNLIYKVEETSFVEQTCTTDYAYHPDHRIESEVCARTGYDEGAESNSIFTYYYTRDKKLVRETIETKNYEVDDTLKLLSEKIYFNNKRGDADSAIYKVYDRSRSKIKMSASKHTYYYGKNDLVLRIETTRWGSKNDTTITRLDEFEYHTNDSVSVRKIYLQAHLIPKRIPNEIRYFDKEGKIQKIEYFNDRNELRNVLKIVYDKRGLCVSQTLKRDDYIEESRFLKYSP